MVRDPVNAFLVEFGARLREARGARTTTFIAKQLGVDQSGYSKFENGKREMPLHLVPVFCDLCNVDPVWLVIGPRRKRAAG